MSGCLYLHLQHELDPVRNIAQCPKKRDHVLVKHFAVLLLPDGMLLVFWWHPYRHNVTQTLDVDILTPRISMKQCSGRNSTTHLICLCDVDRVNRIGTDGMISIFINRRTGQKLWVLIITVQNIDGNGGCCAVFFFRIHFLKCKSQWNFVWFF